jgi:lipocalin
MGCSTTIKFGTESAALRQLIGKSVAPAVLAQPTNPTAFAREPLHTYLAKWREIIRMPHIQQRTAETKLSQVTVKRHSLESSKHVGEVLAIPSTGE